MKFPIIVSALFAASSFLVSADDWNQYRGPNTDGTTAEAVVNTDWSGLKPTWKAETELGFSSFAVAGGRAYTLVEREVDGNPMEVCLALNVADGKEAWAASLGIAKYDGGGDSGAQGNKGGDGPRSTPTVNGDRVYVLDAQINLHCLNAGNGETVWKKDIQGEYGGRNIKWQNAASPMMDGDKIYVAGGGAGQSLIAFDRHTGEPVWKTGDETMTHATPVAATLHGERQVIFFTQSGLVGVRAADGVELWKHPFPFSVSTAASPVVFEDIVYCSAGYGVGGGAARIIKDGDTFSAEEIWRKKGDIVNHWSTPVVKDGFLYGMFSFKDYGNGPLACVDIRTGEKKWEQKGFGPGHVILAGGQVIASGDEGQVVLVNPTPNGYEEVTRIDALEGKSWSTPVLSGGKIFARTVEEAMCLDVSK